MADLATLQLGALIRRFCLAAGLSQEELAERAGLSARGISDLERGQRTLPHLETIRLLAIALDLSDAERSFMLAAARPELQQTLPPAERPVSDSPTERRIRDRQTLPLPPTRLIGRESEVAVLCDLLDRPGSRLVTLTGPGGVGKTRLALAAASENASAYDQGVIFVDLSVLSSASHVIPAILEAAGYAGNPGPEPSEHLIGALCDQSILLVLDNYEHLLDAATVVSTVLTHCPNVSIIVTSRMRLRIRGEHVFDVLPLELPDATGADASQVSGAPAVRLLLEQAEQSGIGFSLNDENRNVITTICRRLDGLPLAIELATSWLRVLSPEQLLERLNQRLSALGGGARDAPARHQTLWDTIAWSLDNLTVGEQRLFRRMAVFTGGATLDTIRHVAAGNDPHDIELMDALSSLVDKSLVRRQEFPAGEPRFFMLETIREFARELLEQSGEAGEFRSAQVAWIVDLTARAEPELVGPNETQWRELLALEQPNVRAALDWSISQGYFESALRISGAMWRFWSKRDLLEGREWFLRVLDLPGEPEPETRARALQALANILHDLGDFPGAQTRFEAALAIRKTLPDKSLQANSLNGLGIVAFAQGEFDRARQLHQESLALSREAGHLVGIGNALSNWSTVERALGQLDRSKALQEEALQVRREFGDEHFIAYSLYNLGTIARAGGRLDDARGLFDEALRLFRSAGDRFGIAFALTDLGVVNQQLGDPELSAAAMREAIAIRQDMGDRRGLIDCFEGVASIAVALQLDQRAATLLGFALRQRANLRSPQTPAERTDVERWSASGQNRLGSAAYNRILASGGDLGVQTAIELAEEVLEEMINSTGVGKA